VAVPPSCASTFGALIWAVAAISSPAYRPFRDIPVSVEMRRLAAGSQLMGAIESAGGLGYLVVQLALCARDHASGDQ
jgi:hypothetical protein